MTLMDSMFVDVDIHLAGALVHGNTVDDDGHAGLLAHVALVFHAAQLDLDGLAIALRVGRDALTLRKTSIRFLACCSSTRLRPMVMDDTGSVALDRKRSSMAEPVIVMGPSASLV